jgi:hypothetical protein
MQNAMTPIDTGTMRDPLYGAEPIWRGPPARFPLIRGGDGLLGFHVAALASGCVGALTAGRHDVPTEFGLLFVTITVGYAGYLAVRMLQRRRALRRTTYEVTDKGLRIHAADRTTTYIWRHLPDAQLRPGRDGTGSISFGPFPDPVETAADFGLRFRFPFYEPPKREPVVVWNVPDAKRLFTAVNAAMKAARPAPHRARPPLTGPTARSAELEKLYRDLTR